MTNKTNIEIGDYVHVYFSGSNVADIKGVVEHAPRQPGDWWIIIEDNGNVCCVQRFEFMRKRISENQ